MTQENKLQAMVTIAVRVPVLQWQELAALAQERGYRAKGGPSISEAAREVITTGLASIKQQEAQHAQ